MDINRRITRHHRLDGTKVLIHPVEILLLLPHVAIHLFLKGGEAIVIDLFALFDLARLVLKGITPEIDFLRVVRAGRERRIDVNKIDLDALVLQVGACAQASPRITRLSVLASVPTCSFSSIS